jgi:hypothetical protein
MITIKKGRSAFRIFAISCVAAWLVHLAITLNLESERRDCWMSKESSATPSCYVERNLNAPLAWLFTRTTGYHPGVKEVYPPTIFTDGSFYEYGIPVITSGLLLLGANVLAFVVYRFCKKR